MSAPATRLAVMATWPEWERARLRYAPQFLGRVVFVSEALGRKELDDILDAVLFLARPTRPVTVVAAPEALPERPSEVVIYTRPRAEAPPSLDASVVFAVQPREPDARRLVIPHEVLQLRDAVIEGVGQRYAGTPLAWLAPRVAHVAETPGVALRFVDGVISGALEDPGASEEDLYVLGLAAALRWLCAGVDAAVVEWMLALALDAPEPEATVSIGASVLGREGALTQALQHGVVYRLPTADDAHLDHRRVFDALRELVAARDGRVIERLHTALSRALPEVSVDVWQRLLFEPHLRLNLSVPEGQYAGRGLMALELSSRFTTTEEVRTLVIRGPLGSGKTTIGLFLAQAVNFRNAPSTSAPPPSFLVATLTKMAGSFASILAPLRVFAEALWLDFRESPSTVWTRVAAALGQPAQDTLHPDDPMEPPPWLVTVLQRVRALRVLILVDNVDKIPETSLPRWLPSGRGRCTVLVFSRSSQAPLQQSNDALVLTLAPMSRLEVIGVLNEHGVRENDLFTDVVMAVTGANLLNLSCLVARLRPLNSGARAQFLVYLASHMIDQTTPALSLGEVFDALPPPALRFLADVFVVITSNVLFMLGQAGLHQTELPPASWEHVVLSPERMNLIPGNAEWAAVLAERNILVRVADGLLMHPLVYEYLQRQTAPSAPLAAPPTPPTPSSTPSLATSTDP